MPAAVDVAALLVGRSLEELRETLRKLVRTPVNFLLVSPTGGGKDCFAQAFHQASDRRDKPLFAINCANLQESLL